MRIVRMKLKKDVTDLLSVISKENGIDDVGFAEDLFSLMRLRGNGLPTKNRISAMATLVATKKNIPEMSINLLMSKRKMLLERLVSLPYFQALCREKDLVLSVRRLMTTFRTFYYKVRQAQCFGCNLKAKCAFGQQYGDSMTDITRVLDPDFEKKVHDECPFRPEISTLNQFNQALNSFKAMMSKQMKAFAAQADKSGVGAKIAPLAQIAEEAMEDPDLELDDNDSDIDPGAIDENYNPISGGGAGKTGRYDNTHTGAHICQVTESFVKMVCNAQLAIFEIGRKFDLALNSRTDKNFKPVVEVERSSTLNQIESESDLPKLASSQHGLPDPVFEARLAKKTLLKRQYQKPEEKKQLLYLLVDSSGSMGGQLCSNSPHRLFTRGSLAALFSLALARKVSQDKGIMYLRFFEGAPGMLHVADTDEEFDMLFKKISKNNFAGGGTDIYAALRTAEADIAAADAKSPLAKAEILMITDCEDSLTEADLRAIIGKREFSVLDVAGSSTKVNQPLKSAATRYYKSNEAAPDINKLVDLL